MYLLHAVLVIGGVATVFSQSCEPGVGNRQSPIDIITANAIRTRAQPLFWSKGYYKSPSSVTLVNDGYTLELLVESASSLTLTAPLLPAYNFVAVHFHWGNASSDTRGAEHYFNGQTYALEMHAVHRSTITNVVDTFLVVAHLFRVADRGLPAMDIIANAAVQAATADIPLPPFPLRKLLFSIPFNYYDYQGSLTTPPNSENARFFVSDVILPISRPQIALFRQAAMVDMRLNNNYRCLQPLNNRQIRYVYH